MRTVAEAFANPELFATSAVAILIGRFGAEFVNWEQETVEMEIRALCPHPDDALFDKIAAASTILSTNTPHMDLLTLNNVCQVLNFDEISGTSFIPAALEDILWGCAEMRLLEGPEQFEKVDFSPDIKAYVGQLLIQHGITTPPSVVEFAEISEDMILNRDDNLGADSLMFEAYWSKQRETVRDMEDFITKRSNKLIAQLMDMPIKHMDNEFIKAAEGVLNDNLS